MSDTCLCGCGHTPPPGKTFFRGHWSRTPAAKAMYKARQKTVVLTNPSGLCMCGCGQPTPIANRSRLARGELKGQPVQYIHNHHARGKTGAATSGWKGGRYVQRQGYIYIHTPDHPAATADGYVFEHRLVAEKMIGRYLEPQERVHHINADPADNRPENLMVLQTQSDHKRLHGNEELARYHASHPNAHSEHGKKGAEARWRKPV